MTLRKLFLLFVVTPALASAVLAQQGGPSPKLVSMPDPVFPSEGIALGYGGKIRVYLDVNKQGKPKVTGAAGPIAPCADLGDDRIKGLRDAAVDAAKKGVFEPASKDGKRIDSFAAVTFNVPRPPLLSNEQGEPEDVDSGTIQGRVFSLPVPEYSSIARQAKARGAVQVQILISDTGNVDGAGPLTGDPLLHDAAVKAACKAKFRSPTLAGKPVKVSGIITYNFNP